jgi:hypothetical protein
LKRSAFVPIILKLKLKRFGFVPIISFDIETRVADLHLLHPDPDLIRIQAFNDQKLRKKITAKKKLNFFGSKTTVYLSLGLHKERPSYRRSLQLSKEAIQHFKK